MHILRSGKTESYLRNRLLRALAIESDPGIRCTVFKELLWHQIKVVRISVHGMRVAVLQSTIMRVFTGCDKSLPRKIVQNSMFLRYCADRTFATEIVGSYFIRIWPSCCLLRNLLAMMMMLVSIWWFDKFKCVCGVLSSLVVKLLFLICRFCAKSSVWILCITGYWAAELLVILVLLNYSISIDLIGDWDGQILDKALLFLAHEFS